MLRNTSTHCETFEENIRASICRVSAEAFTCCGKVARDLARAAASSIYGRLRGLIEIRSFACGSGHDQATWPDAGRTPEDIQALLHDYHL